MGDRKSRQDRAGLPVPAPKVKYILSASEIPAGQNYVLVRYGEKYEETKTSVGPYD